jgi:sec-independent protein translocase protein TatC
MDDKALPLTAHLSELRSRIFKILIVWSIATGLAWTYAEDLFRLLLEPAIAALGPDGGRLLAISPAEIFFTYFRVSMLAGFVFTVPVFFWQVWAFVAPGLYPKERRIALPFVFVTSLLFMSGAVFAHQLVFPAVFRFFASYRSDFVQPSWTMEEVYSLTTNLLLAFGLCFELPVLIFFIALSGIVTTKQLFAWTKYAVLIAFVVAGVITPTPDPATQTLLAVPLIALYVLGIGVAWLFGAREKKPEPSAEKGVAATR